MIPDHLQKIGNESRRLLAEAMVETLNGSPDPAQTLAKAARGKKLHKEYMRGTRELISKMKAEIALSKATAALWKNPDEAVL